jgi:hypothetical protein
LGASWQVVQVPGMEAGLPSAGLSAEVDEGVFRPKVVAEKLSIDDLAGGFEEQEKQLKGLILQADAALAKELSRVGEGFKDAEAEDASAMSRVGHGLIGGAYHGS